MTKLLKKERKSTCCSSRGLWFESQHAHGGLQLCSSLLKNSTLSSALRILDTRVACTSMQSKHL